MAAPTPGNMDNCDPKCKCRSGPYANQAYKCDDPCAGQVGDCTFSCEDGCNCGGCYQVCAVVRFVDGKTDDISEVRCSFEYCGDPLIQVDYSPTRGVSASNISVDYFYSPGTCGIANRGALVSYQFATDCDGDPEIARTFSAVRSNSVDVQPTRCDVYLAPFPFPAGCTAPTSGRISEGAGVIPDCFVHVASATNPNADRLAC